MAPRSPKARLRQGAASATWQRRIVGCATKQNAGKYTDEHYRKEPCDKYVECMEDGERVVYALFEKAKGARPVAAAAAPAPAPAPPKSVKEPAAPPNPQLYPGGIRAGLAEEAARAAARVPTLVIPAEAARAASRMPTAPDPNQARVAAAPPPPAAKKTRSEMLRELVDEVERGNVPFLKR